MRKLAIPLPKGPEYTGHSYNMSNFSDRALAEVGWIGKIVLDELDLPAEAGARMGSGGSATRRVA